VGIQVNGQPVDDQLIRDEARRLKDLLRAEMPGADSLELELRAREWAKENVIVRTLLGQAAGSESPQDLMGRLLSKVPRPKTQEIWAHYRKFAHLYQRPEMVRAAHIVKNVDETATEAQAAAAIGKIEDELRRGAQFGELADTFSDCPGSGGDLGLFPPGEMVKEFDEQLAKLQPGETSGVFRTEFGFHIAKLIERRPAGQISWNELRDQIEKQLWDEKRDRAAAEFMKGLREKADIRKA